MNKIVLGLLGAFALASVTLPAAAAPDAAARSAAPVTAAVFYPEASDAAVQTVQYRRHPPRRYGHYERHYAPHRYAGRGYYRGRPRY